MSRPWPSVISDPRPAPGPPLSIEEWADLREDEMGELVDGQLVEEEVPDAVHELAATWLIALLRGWLGTAGFVFGSELKVAIGQAAGRKPDVAIFFPGSRIPSRRGPVTVAPDLVIEVISPSPHDERRDRVEKMDDYARFGIRFYWLVDPALGSFEIFERTTTGYYTRLVGATAGRIDPVPGCNGLVIDIDALWAELRRLPDDHADEPRRRVIIDAPQEGR
jgi:Uma2 family endonuclease